MVARLIRPDNGQPAEYVTYLRGHVCLRTTCITPAVRWFTHEQMMTANPMVKPDELEPVQGCALPPSHIAADQLQQDIADALALWRKIVFIPGAPIVRLEPDDMMAVNDSRNVTVIPARAA